MTTAASPTVDTATAIQDYRKAVTDARQLVAELKAARQVVHDLEARAADQRITLSAAAQALMSAACGDSEGVESFWW